MKQLKIYRIGLFLGVLVLMLALAGGLAAGVSVAHDMGPLPPPGDECPTTAWPPCQPDPTSGRGLPISAADPGPLPPPGNECPTFAWPPCQPDPTSGEEIASAGGMDKPSGLQFISPANGETVWGKVTVLVLAPFASPLGPDQDVLLAIDGGGWQTMAAQGNGFYAAKWDTAYYQNGWHDLLALYEDAAGAEYLAHIQVNVCQRLQPCIDP